MDPKKFNTQISRLIERFGERNFGKEFIKLIAIEVKDMEARWFQNLITKMISELPVNRPPLLKDFRIPAYHERQIKLSEQTATSAKDWSAVQGSLTNYLRRTGSKDLNEAFRKAKKKTS